MESSSLPSLLPLGNYLAIRININSDTTPSQVGDFFKSYLSPFITVLEDADESVNRTHTHTLLKTEISINTFRKQLKKIFPKLNGNKDFAIQQVNDKEASFRYVSKGLSPQQPPQVVVSTFGAPLVAQAHVSYWNENARIIDSNSITKRKNTGSCRKTWTDETLDELRKEFMGIEVLDEETVIRLTQAVLKRLGKTAKKFSQRILTEMVLGFGNALLLEYAPEKKYKEWTRHVGSAIYRDSNFLGRDF